MGALVGVPWSPKIICGDGGSHRRRLGLGYPCASLWLEFLGAVSWSAEKRHYDLLSLDEGKWGNGKEVVNCIWQNKTFTSSYNVNIFEFLHIYSDSLLFLFLSPWLLGGIRYTPIARRCWNTLTGSFTGISLPNQSNPVCSMALKTWSETQRPGTSGGGGCNPDSGLLTSESWSEQFYLLLHLFCSPSNVLEILPTWYGLTAVRIRLVISYYLILWIQWCLNSNVFGKPKVFVVINRLSVFMSLWLALLMPSH